MSYLAGLGLSNYSSYSSAVVPAATGIPVLVGVTAIADAPANAGVNALGGIPAVGHFTAYQISHRFFKKAFLPRTRSNRGINVTSPNISKIKIMFLLA
jgi:hypothetical protein